MNEETTNFTAIYYRHVDTVYRVCFMLLKNRSDTEDAVQTVFTKLLQSNKTFVDVEHEKAWLIRTAQNHCKNVLRHWWRRKKITTDELPENGSIHSDHLKDVWKLVLELPAKYKTVVYLYYYEGYKTYEIASLLDIKESTVRSQLHKARKLLKIHMEREGHFYESRRVESSH